ncbi:MAG: AmmeMemoRadiSam system protein B [Candidatus Omnitrophica bacterium]|nr:AmmeMemoRadiSam system protein B [Candidatus Omnitrophota bacterium]
MPEAIIRNPLVADRFYPGRPQEIKKQVETFLKKFPSREKVDAVGVVSPHAGYIYSGSVAARVLSHVNLKRRIIILGPNHTGIGAPFSIMREGLWRLPAGDVEIDTELADMLLDRSSLLKDDPSAHQHEHSIEVQIPIIQVLSEMAFKIVPITIMGSRISELKSLGEAIGSVVKEKRAEVLIVASSDMTHYEPQDTAEEKDRKAIDAILRMDPEGLIEEVEKSRISMCGCAPVAIMLFASKLVGATRGELVAYQTSGDVSGDRSSVVGYAGAIIR